MKCPMTFNDPCTDRDEECRGKECMWYMYMAINSKEEVEGCAIAIGAVSVQSAANLKYSVGATDKNRFKE